MGGTSNQTAGLFSAAKDWLVREPGREAQLASIKKSSERDLGLSRTPAESKRIEGARASMPVGKPPVDPKISPDFLVTAENRGASKVPSKLGTFTRGGKTQDVTTNSDGGLFLGKSPVKEAMFIRSEAAKTLPGVGGTPAPAIPGMPASQSMMPGGNWTGLMDMETAALTSAMKPGAGVPGAPQPSFGGPGQSGPGQDGDRVYREIESQISSLFNTQKALINGNYSPSGMGSLSPGQRMRYASQLGEQIKGLQDTLTNRSGLANELVKALIGAQTATATANTAAGAELGKASITGGATVQAADVTARGDLAAAQNKQATDADNKAKMRRHSDLNALVSSYQKEYETTQSPEVKSKLDEARRELAALNVEVGDWDFSKAPN